MPTSKRFPFQLKVGKLEDGQIAETERTNNAVTWKASALRPQHFLLIAYRLALPSYRVGPHAFWFRKRSANARLLAR